MTRSAADLSAAPSVLIVDDDAAGRETLEALLSPLGYSLRLAASGAQALESATADPPDLVLLDVMMPDLDGFEVCSQLRSDPRLGEVPVVMVTALDDEASRVRGIEAGADDLISKPFNRTELRARVRTITRLNRFRRLAAERAKFAWAVERSADGYVTLGGDDTVLYANAPARAYLGLGDGPRCPAGAPFLELARRGYRLEPEAAWTTWGSAIPAGPVHLVRPESRTAPPLWLRVEALDVPTGSGGRVVWLRDVTDQMARARDMGCFHAMVSHKLRTPLNGLLGSLDLLARDPGVRALESAAELAQLARNTARRLADHILDILRFLDAPLALGEEGGCPISRIATLTAEVAAAVGIRCPGVAADPSCGAATLAIGDRALEVVLSELLENAKKFHPRNDPAVCVEVAPAGTDAVTVRVADDGRRLPVEWTTWAWWPYYQPEKMFTGEVQGTGLGLATVAALVWGVGGRCRMANRAEGTGVVVELVLPVAHGAARR